MDDPSRAAYAKLEASLADMPRQIGATPAAVLMVSAHWEEAEFTLTSNPKPPMIYDYYGFPDYTYQIHYDAPGDPALAARAQSLIEAAGFAGAARSGTRLRSRRVHAAEGHLSAGQRAGGAAVAEGRTGSGRHTSRWDGPSRPCATRAC